MELRQAKKIFYIAKRAQNISPQTLSLYDIVLRKFFQFLVEEKNVYAIEEITPEIIREFMDLIQNEKKSGYTAHIYYRTVHTFVLFLFQNDYIQKDPMKHIKPPKLPKKVMRTFTPQEINKLLNSFDRNDFFGMRNYTIMAMFFSTGMRKGELANLTLADVNITNDLIRIAHGKGRKERYVPIGRTLRRALIRYLKMREEYLQGESCEYLFISKRKTRKMTPSCLNILFQKLKKRLKLTGERISCHTWRHTFAKNYLMNGGDIFSLQKILGHADISTTQVYLSLNDDEVKTQHAKYNPLDNKDWLY